MLAPEMLTPEPTHFLCLAHPPRPTFVHDATPEEREIMGRHAVFLKDLLDRGKLLLAGPCLDGAYGVAIFKTSDADEVRRILLEDPAKGLFAKVEIHSMRVGLLATNIGGG
jgi:uncharacterized protein